MIIYKYKVKDNKRKQNGGFGVDDKGIVVEDGDIIFIIVYGVSQC